MATYYSQGTGNFSTLANWDTARAGGGTDPASVAAMNNHTFVIQPGHTVTFDIEDAPAVDGSVSGWTNGIKVIVEGANAGSTPGHLTLSTASNTPGLVYGLRLTHPIAGTNKAVFGRITGGSAETPMPTGANHVWLWAYDNFDTRLNTQYLAVNLYATPPIERVYRLTAPAALGATELHVAGDVTPASDPADETEWKAGWAVALIPRKPYDVEGPVDRATLAATPTGAGIINLAEPLPRDYAVNDAIVLVQRNIDLRSLYGTSGAVIANPNATPLNVYSCSVRAIPDDYLRNGALLSGKGSGTGPATVCSHGNAGIGFGVAIADGAVFARCFTGASWMDPTSNIGDALIIGCYTGCTGTMNPPAGTLMTGTGARIESCYLGIDDRGNPIGAPFHISYCVTGINASAPSIDAAHIIDNCDTGAALTSFSGADVPVAMSITDCAVGMTVEYRANITGDVSVTDCGIAFDQCNGLTLGGHSAVTGCLTGLSHSHRCTIKDDASITTIRDTQAACLESCADIVVQDRARIECEKWVAKNVSNLVIDGPDVMCGTENSSNTFHRCEVTLFEATVLPVDPYDEAIHSTVLEGYGSTFKTVPDGNWPRTVSSSEDLDPTGFGGISYLRMWDYGGAASRYPHIWCGRVELFPSSNFSPMPAGEPEVVTCKLWPWEYQTYCWYEVPLETIPTGLFEIDALFCADQTGLVDAPTIGIYDAPRNTRGNGSALALWTPSAVPGEWQRRRLRWMNVGRPTPAWLRFTVTGLDPEADPFALAYRAVTQPIGPFGLAGARMSATVARAPITLPAWER